jgi:FAD/FMN-containing dehydrogenase
VTGAWVAGMEVVLAPGELVQLGGWAGKDVAGYDLKSLLIGSEGTLGVLTAVRLRLLPAPEEALPLVVFLRTRAQGCAAMREVLANGLRPSVLDFMDGHTLRALAGAYPGSLPPELPAHGRFALICEVDGSHAEARAQRDALLELMRGQDGTLAIDEPADPRALWRWRDGANPAVTAVRGGKVSEDVVFPLERIAEGLERFEQIAAAHGMSSCAWGHGGEGNVHATVLVDPHDEAELDRADAVVSRSRESTAWAGTSAGAWRRSGTRGRSSCTSRSSARSTPRACSTPERSWRCTLRARRAHCVQGHNEHLPERNTT